MFIRLIRGQENETMSEEIKYLTKEELEAGLDEIQKSPSNNGILEMIVCRPKKNAREVLETGELDVEVGLVGDNWKTRGSWATKDKKAHPEMQINIMNSRAIALIAVEKERWQLAGDQLFVDLNLSDENLPTGSHLQIGDAILEVTEVPHNGCAKFTKRFGKEATKFANSKIGKQLHLRGINAKVIKNGKISVGYTISKI